MTGTAQDAAVEIAMLRAELAKYRRRTYCEFCCSWAENDPTGQVIAAHSRTCESHPMRALEERVKEVEAAREGWKAINDKRVAEITRLTADLGQARGAITLLLACVDKGLRVIDRCGPQVPDPVVTWACEAEVLDSQVAHRFGG